MHRVFFVARHPQLVGRLHLDNAGDEGAPKGDVRRQPRPDVAKRLVEVDLSAYCQQIARTVGGVATTLVVPLARTFVPGVDSETT
jgi:pimeloyl-ACP methyl ester carboxylesterase